MSKNRFYVKALELVRGQCGQEIADDISAYTANIEFERSLLVSELKRANTFGGRALLCELAYIPSADDEQFCAEKA